MTGINKIEQLPPLTDEQRTMILGVIRANMAPNDEDPSVIIGEKFGGNSDKYLRCMASWHGIDISLKEVIKR